MKLKIGEPTLRLEDERLLRGEGCYTDDIDPGEGLRVAFLRAPFAHARLTVLDLADARALAGVHLVASQADLDADKIGDIRCTLSLKNEDGSEMVKVSKPAMVRDINRSAGDIVAIVVAENQQIANDALELIEARYDAMEAVADVYAAMADGAPQLYEEYKNNIALNWVAADHEGTNAAFAHAARDGLETVEIDIVNSRVIVNALETRPMIAGPGERPRTIDIWCGTQGPVPIAEKLAVVLNMPVGDVRVRTLDVGGGFGYKIFLYPEQVAIAWAARRLGRRIRWQQARSDGFLSDLQGRDNRSRVRALVDKDGRVHAAEVTVHVNLGSWLSNFGPGVPTLSGARALTTNYRIPHASLRVLGVLTNTPAVDAYRGAGRPESNYVMERLMDHVAAHVGISRIEVRRRNLIRPQDMPYRMVIGGSIDTGDMPGVLEEALVLADHGGFTARRAQSEAAGKWRGFGATMYLEQCGDGGGNEGVDIRFQPNGDILLLAGMQDNGQSHRTTLTQILSDKLGYDANRITIQQGDSARTPSGTTGGARMSIIIGSGVAHIAMQTLRKAMPYATDLLGCTPDNLSFNDGLFLAQDSNRSIGLDELVIKLAPANGAHPFDMYYAYESSGATYPYGCHAVEIEVDPNTCLPQIQRYTVVDDFGVILNPVTLRGQVQGGIAQGVGQALYEHAAFDDRAQLLAGSLMDYTLPRADHLPSIDVHFRGTPTRNNRLEIKGSGQAGAIGSTQAVISALCDALGVTHIDMPATPAAIWRAMQAKQQSKVE